MPIIKDDFVNFEVKNYKLLGNHNPYRWDKIFGFINQIAVPTCWS